jgi:two-component system nitrogen regulation response regulator NtrX
VRELRNTLERMVILADGNRLTAADVPFQGPKRSSEAGSSFLEAPTFEEFKEESEKAYLRRQLDRRAWNIQQTAKELAMQRSNLYKKIEKYGLGREPER